jgi:hypothetical protein
VPLDDDQLRVGPRLLSASAGFAVALLLALCAAHYYRPPSASGGSGKSIWLETDFLFGLASSAVALVVGLISGRAATGAGALAARSLVARVMIWAGLTVVLFFVWADHTALSTLLIAPTHGFAGLRLLALGRRWRADVAWRRFRTP